MLRGESALDKLTQRQMNGTRYTTRLAAELLSTLYGGRDVARTFPASSILLPAEPKYY
jgi:hypothetical protein